MYTFRKKHERWGARAVWRQIIWLSSGLCFTCYIKIAIDELFCSDFVKNSHFRLSRSGIKSIISFQLPSSP